MRIFFFLILLIFCTTTQSQAQRQGQPLIDSLLSRLPRASEDTNKVMLLNDLSLAYYSINPEKGLLSGKQALALAQKLEWKKGMAYAYKVIAGNYGYGKSDYAAALDYSLKGLQLFKENGDRTGTAKMLGDIGELYWFMSDYPHALKYFFDALRIDEKLGIKNEEAATLCNIGIIYNSQKDYAKALEYMLRANRIDDALQNKNGVASNLANISELYISLSNNTKALEYSSKSLQLFEELGDKNGLARNFGILATIYTDQKEYSKSLEYSFKALQINRELENKVGVAAMFGSIGNTYLEMAKDTGTSGGTSVVLQRAKIYTDSAIAIFKEIGNLNSVSANNRLLSEIQSMLGNYKGALESYKNYTLYKDSVFNIEKDKKLTETAMQYAFNKKESTAKAEQEKKDIRQRNIRNSVIAGAAVLLLLLVALINRYRYKQKANREIATAYEHLKNTQQQLLQSEKMAAFGVMATRMAHEIQNPLNFVNNFSDISEDLVKGMLIPGNDAQKAEAGQNLIRNLEKINHHGNRAATIISELQEHARLGSAQQFFEEENSGTDNALLKAR